MQVELRSINPGLAEPCVGASGSVNNPTAQCWQIRVPEPAWIEDFVTQYVIPDGSGDWTVLMPVQVGGRPVSELTFTTENFSDDISSSVTDGSVTVVGKSLKPGFYAVRVMATLGTVVHTGNTLIIVVLV